ncbi:MAG: nitroreductase family protein, partial [Achromobacter pestifer]
TGFDPAGVADAFGLQPDEVPVMLVAMGYAKPGNWPQKPRRPVTDVLELA